MKSALTRALDRLQPPTTTKLRKECNMETVSDILDKPEDFRQFWRDRLETKIGWMRKNATQLLTDASDLTWYALRAEQASYFDENLDALLSEAIAALTQARLQVVDTRARLHLKLDNLEAAE